MIQYRVHHATRYDYGDEVVNSHNEVHLQPLTTPTQRAGKVSLRIVPAPEEVSWHRDYFDNPIAFFALQTPHQKLAIRAESEVAVDATAEIDRSTSTPWNAVGERLRADPSREALAAFEFVFDSPFVAASPALAEYARPSFPPGRPFAEAALELSHRIFQDFRYDPDATTLDTPVEEALRNRHGVCQDYAHVMIGGLRSLGLPARYVSGYLATSTRPSDAALIGAEASHAWVSAWCPEHGWMEFDPTNDLVPGERHVVLAYGRDYDDVSPVKGVTIGGGSHTVKVEVSVQPTD